MFTVASLLCGVAQSQEMLVGARFVQGVGGAMTSAVILGMIVTMFPEPREQAKAIGVYSFVASAGGSIGLLAGGVLTQSINWHWIFFVNIPIGVATAVLARRLLERDEGIGFGKGADMPGAVLITSALMLGVYTIVKPAADYGWARRPQTLGLGAVSLALLVAFVVREATARNPLIPLRIFRSRNVSGANAIQALMVAGMFGMFFLGALYLQRVLGYDALEIGLAFLPVTLVIGALSLRYSERLITRFGARATLLPGLALIAAGLALFARAPVDGNYVQRRAARDAAARPRRRPLLPGADDAGHVGRHPGGRRAGLRAREHHAPGGRRAGPGGAGHPVDHAHRRPAGRRRGARPPALTSGYHLAFVIGAGLLVAAIAVAVDGARARGGRGRGGGDRGGRRGARLLRGRLASSTGRPAQAAAPNGRWARTPENLLDTGTLVARRVRKATELHRSAPGYRRSRHATDRCTSGPWRPGPSQGLLAT